MGKKGVMAAGFLMALSLFAGCDFHNGGGSAVIEICYPSGYSRDCYTWDETSPVEGTSYRLQAEKSENFKKTRRYDLQILGEDSQMIYEYPEAGYSVLRGEAAWDEYIWIVTENWNSPHYNGYISGDLTESILMLADMETGEILFQKELAEDELFLTSERDRCYFYDCGQRESEKWFGLLKIPGRNARIYYREKDSWEEEVWVYTFDYELEPEMDKRSIEDRVRFLLDDKKIVVSMTTSHKKVKSQESGEETEEEIPYETSIRAPINDK